jgi:hypothetical protein
VSAAPIHRMATYDMRESASGAKVDVHKMVSVESWWHEPAQICLNGHLLNDRSLSRPGPPVSFCTACGADIIERCPGCGGPINGRRQPLKMYAAPYVIPAYCHSCSKQYPWTKRHLEAAEQLVDASKLSAAEKKVLKDLMPDLIYETPRSRTAVARITDFLERASPPLVSSMREILMSVATDAIKKTIGL